MDIFLHNFLIELMVSKGPGRFVVSRIASIAAFHLHKRRLIELLGEGLLSECSKCIPGHRQGENAGGHEDWSIPTMIHLRSFTCRRSYITQSVHPRRHYRVRIGTRTSSQRPSMERANGVLGFSSRFARRRGKWSSIAAYCNNRNT